MMRSWQWLVIDIFLKLVLTAAWVVMDYRNSMARAAAKPALKEAT